MNHNKSLDYRIGQRLFSFQLVYLAFTDIIVNHGRRGRQSSRASGGSQALQRTQKSQSGRTKRKRSTQSQDGLFDDSVDEIELSDHDIMKLRKHLLITLQVCYHLYH